MEDKKTELRKDLENAYKKYKAYVYYNNTDINNKIKIAEFECDIDTKLDKLEEIIQNKGDIQKYLEDINYFLLPKSFKSLNNSEECQIITNKNICDKYELGKYNFFIDMPIELHIINVLWIMKLGYVLDEDYCEHYEKSLSCCYANRLKLDKDKEVIDGNVLFKFYRKQYTKWRDDCISKAEDMIKQDKDIIIFSLDIKGYYNSVSLDFKDVKKHIENIIKNEYNENKYLTDYIERIRDTYVSRIKADFPEFLEEDNKFNEKLLPIGMLASNILANWYLYKFDKKILNKVNPIFYGRYVDDILIVLENNKTCAEEICKQDCPKKNFKTKTLLKKYFEDIFTFDENENKNKNEYPEYFLKDFNNLVIQSEKVKIFSFDSNSSIALLTKFKENIKKHISEFRFLPEDDRIENDLVQEGYSIHYCDSINKLRSIEKYRLDKFKISTFLAKQLSVSKYIKDKEHFKNVLKELKYSFSGRLSLELYMYWYKVLVYIVINEDLKEFKNFTNTISKTIEKIKYCKDKKNKKTQQIIQDKIIKNLQNLFYNGIKYALSYNPSFIFELENKKTEFKTELLDTLPKYNILNKKLDSPDSLRSDLKNILKSNIINHSYCFLPIITYFVGNEESFINLVTPNILTNSTILDANFWEKPELDDNKIKYNPCNIKYSDILLFYFYQKIITQKEKLICFGNNKDYKNKYNNSKLIFKEINKVNKKYKKNDLFIFKDQPQSQFVKLKEEENENKLSEVYVGLYNTKISEKELEDNVIKPNKTTFDEFQNIMKFLNLSIRNTRCNVIVLPEVSISVQYIELLQDFSRRNNIAIIAGLKHIIVKDKNEKTRNVYNCIMTILPFKNELNSSDNITFIRNKKYYAPNERGMLEEHKLNIVDDKDLKNPIFCWRDLYFSCFDCFELADIEFRSECKSKVDMIIACEWNRDTNYFDKIIESATRDLHCYVVQVNTSQYGHSKIIAPKSKDEMTILNITGGKDNILIGEINIKELREFQKLKHIPKSKYKFKPLPPNFIKDSDFPERLK